MDKVGSPFLGEIKQCKQSMRKLRKKIYKYRMARNECVGRGKGSQE